MCVRKSLKHEDARSNPALILYQPMKITADSLGFKGDSSCRGDGEGELISAGLWRQLPWQPRVIPWSHDRLETTNKPAMAGELSTMSGCRDREMLFWRDKKESPPLKRMRPHINCKFWQKVAPIGKPFFPAFEKEAELKERWHLTSS